MSSPFSSVSSVGLPPWTKQTPNAGNFMPVTLLSTVTNEVGYGEGGFGEGGYDTPTSVASSSATPNWVPGSNR